VPTFRILFLRLFGFELQKKADQGSAVIHAKCTMLQSHARAFQAGTASLRRWRTPSICHLDLLMPSFTDRQRGLRVCRRQEVDRSDQTAFIIDLFPVIQTNHSLKLKYTSLSEGIPRSPPRRVRSRVTVANVELPISLL
jgi:hypothetical protein